MVYICILFAAIAIGAISISLIFTSSNNHPVYHEYFYLGRDRNIARDGMAVIWIDRDTPAIIDVATGREIRRFESGRRLSYFHVNLMPDGLVEVGRIGLPNIYEFAVLDIETGSEIIPLNNWGRIVSVSNGIAIVGRRGILGVIDLETGNELVSPKLVYNIRFTSDTMVEVRPHQDDVSTLEWHSGVVNVIDLNTGKELPPNPLSHFGDGAAIVQSSNGLAVVELLGQRTILSPSSQSVALIDLETGDILIPFDEFPEILYFSYGMAVVRRDEGEIGLIDIAGGDEIIPFGKYGYILILSENTVAVRDSRVLNREDRERHHLSWGVVDIASGVETIPIGEYYSHRDNYREGVILVFCRSWTSSVAVIDTATGEEIIPFRRYSNIILLPDGLIAIFDRSTRLWRFGNLAEYR